MVMPADALIKVRTEGTGSVPEYMRSLEDRLQLLHQIAKENILASQEVYKKQYDKQAKPCEYAVGDKLWMLSPGQVGAGTSKKMQIKYNKLVVIKEKVGDYTYRVADATTGLEYKFLTHVDNLRSYTPTLTAEDYTSKGFKRPQSVLVEHAENDPEKTITGENKRKELNEEQPEQTLLADETRDVMLGNQEHDKNTPGEKNKETKASGDRERERTKEIQRDTQRSRSSSVQRETHDRSVRSKEVTPDKDLNMTKNTLDETDLGSFKNARELIGSKQSTEGTLYLVHWRDDTDPVWVKQSELPQRLVEEFNKKFYPSGRERRIVHI